VRSWHRDAQLAVFHLVHFLNPPFTRLTAALADRYRIERELGHGGMATVYIARDLKHDRDVAIKVMRPELSGVLGSDRFLSEIRIAARLGHPHILPLIDSGEAAGLLYYVMPMVRGESLRARLERERQLPVDEAVAITRQLAGALQYAHQQGIIHRDIKPENILFQEGQAVLTDFGIALALHEAGGSRLTETGLAIGTPQYMSPEQALGDRQIDARSDIYSLAVVLYEMIAGEPPFTGPTAQAIVAKRLTQSPIRLREVRDTVPESVESAVSRALARVPSDRFSGAAAFADALSREGAKGTRTPTANRSRWLLAALPAAALVALGLWFFGTGETKRERVVQGTRAQLTFTGNVRTPAISPDGKQVAFYVRSCTEDRCRYQLEVEDIGAPTARPILDGITGVYPGLRWSPDRRNVLAWATIGGRFGRYLISASTGSARYLTPGAAEFYAGGDSLLVGPPFRADSVFWVRVMSLDGVVHDSFPIVHQGTALAELTVVPGSPYLVTQIYLPDGGHLWQVVDRHGKILSESTTLVPASDNLIITQAASSEALWLGVISLSRGTIRRVPLDQSGHFTSPSVTVGFGTFTSFSVTSDGSALVLDDGTFESSTWSVPLADALKGRLPESERLLRATSSIAGFISPDGHRLLVRRLVPSSTGEARPAYSVMPSTGGAEKPLTIVGEAQDVSWLDSVSLVVVTRASHGLHLAVTDIRTNAMTRSEDLPDSTVIGEAIFPGGVGWLASYDRAMLRRGSETVTIGKPPWFNILTGIDVDRAGERVLLTGWNLGTGDSLGFAVVPASGGPPVLWAASPGEDGTATFLDDGSILWIVFDTEETARLFRLTAPGKVTAIGAIPRAIRSIQVSRDLKRASINVRDYRGDAWITKLIRQ
jgi:hypothetical protein